MIEVGDSVAFIKKFCEGHHSKYIGKTGIVVDFWENRSDCTRHPKIYIKDLDETVCCFDYRVEKLQDQD